MIVSCIFAVTYSHANLTAPFVLFFVDCAAIGAVTGLFSFNERLVLGVASVYPIFLAAYWSLTIPKSPFSMPNFRDLYYGSLCMLLCAAVTKLFLEMSKALCLNFPTANGPDLPSE